MPESMSTQGPVKSLRQATPGGDLIAGFFALVALLIAVGVVRNPPSPLGLLLSVVFILLFAGPAYVLYSSSRATGIFVSDDRVEFRLLGQVRQSWKRAEVGAIEASAGGLRLLAPDGRVLRQFKFRWWSTELVTRFASSTGMGAAQREAALSAVDVDPGKAGDG